MQKINMLRSENIETVSSHKTIARQMTGTKFIKTIAELIIIMALCTAVSILVKRAGAHEANTVMVYLLGIVLFSYLASGYLFSLFASVCGVLFYNFFFTEPYFTLRAYNPDYLITFLIMFIVGFFTSVLTNRIKRETLLAEEREERIKALYHTGRRLLGVTGSEDLARVSAEELSNQFSANVLVELFDSSGAARIRYISGKDIFSDDKERTASYEAYHSGNPCGCGTSLFSSGKGYYLPVIGQSGVLGIIGISLPTSAPLTGIQMQFLDTIAPQVAVVLERERLYEKQKETQIQVQRERLRADMLRTISHDLRTPLTGIMGSASTMLDNFESVNNDIKKSFLQNIYDDASWLNELVENILNITRFDEGRVKLNIGQEAAEEIVAEAIGHVNKRSAGHTILARLPSEIVLLEVDGVLITQVLVNLLTNAINYTPAGSEITVSLSHGERGVVFEVSDNGPGISESDLPHMFERLYSRHDKAYGSRGGSGLGLFLCKSIIQAHGGAISIENQKPHGMVVRFCIPSKEETGHAAPNSDR